MLSKVFAFSNLFLWIITCLFICCKPKVSSLPILGDIDLSGGDTVYHEIPDFIFADQHGDSISKQKLKGKVYVADFFFTKCPTICPKMSQQMLRLQEQYIERTDFNLLSHSIDPKYDTIAALKKYADKLGIGDSKTWHFLSVPKDQLNRIARSYLAALQEDNASPGGFTHSGHFLLIDRQSHIRSFCDGTKPKDVDRLMTEIDFLLNETK